MRTLIFALAKIGSAKCSEAKKCFTFFRKQTKERNAVKRYPCLSAKTKRSPRRFLFYNAIKLKPPRVAGRFLDS